MTNEATTASLLEALRKLDTPTVSNAVELVHDRPHNTGFMSPEIRCLFPDLGVLVGHAVTARYAAREAPSTQAARPDFWKYLMEIPEPRVVVMEDLDDPPGVGAYFGEVQTNIHVRLGCAGVVTNGCVRDLDEVHEMGFHYFAAGACVSHSYVHLVDFGKPITIGGLNVQSGDLIHADKHGVLSVPLGIATEVPKAAAKVSQLEAKILNLCKSSEFSLERLNELYLSIKKEFSRPNQ